MSLDNIIKRAKYLAKIRDYFNKLNVLEVDTPLAYDYPVTDPFIDVFSIDTKAGTKYLQSSPEYAMKRLLAEGSGCIYQITKAFRDDDKSRVHNPEFTMLEWYRIGIDYFQLMKEIELLFSELKSSTIFKYMSYQELFEEYLGFNPHTVSTSYLEEKVLEVVGEIYGDVKLSVADCLDILFSFKIEKKLNDTNTVYFVYDYTKYQSALSKKIIDDKNQIVSARFEMFSNGIELANGYDELIDKKEQLLRFNSDLDTRKIQNKKAVEIDYKLIDCLDNVPDCSGVAIGLDRVIMCLEGIDNISDLSIF